MHYADTPQQPAHHEQGSDKRLKMALIVSVVLVVLAGAAAVFFFVQYQSNKPDAKKNGSSQGLSNDEVISKVNKLYDNKENERPSVAQVGDKEKLKGQAFFDNAKTGDYVLIYPKAKTAVIYRNSENRIINIGPVVDQ